MLTVGHEGGEDNGPGVEHPKKFEAIYDVITIWIF